ncbi:MAG TPA: phosphoribosyltransferase family protein [Candidatus Eremiobacteraceae bacterium]|nr:phosphoribosyltransferase family protein [Candidatus Eremiobacteraceae bacterium]
MFADRHAAGELLGARLAVERRPAVLGIARGGVIVADAVARVLSAPLDVLVIRKVGHPLQNELALGAVSASGEAVRTPYAAEFSEAQLAAFFARAADRARSLERALRPGPPLDVRGSTAIVVDDGIATSATMSCAVAHARDAGAARIICAAPVSPADSIPPLLRLCDVVEVLTVSTDRDFAVGRFYADFREVDDRQVAEVLARAQNRPPP